MSKLNAIIKSEKFPELLDKLEDLAKISDTIKWKIDKEHILMYSIVGEAVLLAFKNYVINTKEFLDISGEIEGTIDVIITGGKKFVKNLNFIKIEEKIKLSIDFRTTDEEDTAIARLLQIKNGKIKITLQGGESSQIKDISKIQLEKRIDLKNSKWSFKVSNTEFSEVKKLCSINSDGKILHLNIDDGKVLFSETSVWEYQVDEVNLSDRHLMFNKSLLSSITDSAPVINFYIFDTFILTRDLESNLMISFEQDFSVDED